IDQQVVSHANILGLCSLGCEPCRLQFTRAVEKVQRLDYAASIVDGRRQQNIDVFRAAQKSIQAYGVPTNQNVLNAFVLKALQQIEKGIGGVACHGQRLCGIELPGNCEPAQCIESLELGESCARDTTRMGGRCECQHAIELPAKAPCLDRIEHEFRAVLIADDACH